MAVDQATFPFYRSEDIDEERFFEYSIFRKDPFEANLF
jgi:hypothetical protein